MAEDHDHRDPCSPVHAPRKPRSKKDRKRWCRGKVGVGHETHIALMSWARTRDLGCHEVSVGKWVNYADHRSFERTGETYWACYHVIECTNCGRHMRSLSDDECPDRVKVPA